jgi:hypothetical protein
LTDQQHPDRQSLPQLQLHVQTLPFPSPQSTQLAGLHSICEQSASTTQVPPMGTTPDRFELDEERLELDEEPPPELLPLLSVAGGRS